MRYLPHACRALILAVGLSACAGTTQQAVTAPRDSVQTLSGSGGVNAPAQRDKPYLILISIDGFKAEYFDRFELPGLRRVAQRGARAKAMIPVFPSLTFPNHYSLVTGLHPQRHGIVSNRFYDPARKDTYALGDAQTVSDGSWYGGEPIWVTAETQGMVAACYFWPGSEAAIKGVRPTTYNKYSSGVSNETRVQTVLDWLQLPAERRPHMITLYFSEVDEVSHSGPLESPDVLKAAQSVDAAIGSLVAGIDGLPVRDQVYLVITSDHGMVNGSDAQTVRLESLLDAPQLADIAVGFGGPVANLHITGGPARAREIRDRINLRLARGTAYLRQDVPERLQFRENPRAGDVVVVMDEAWAMSTPRPAARTPARPADAAAEQTAKPASPGRPPRERWGMHGWDNAFPSMRAFFLVSGPGIRRGAIVDEVRTVDVYSLMTELLDLRPASGIDGEAGRIRALVK
ncbi:MAG: ectonucleotide pyrophosphatase/phosphodiesterase [Vicinamibacterales bacterium]